MRHWIPLMIVLAIAVKAETLDRIAVTVGNQVVTENQTMLALRATALVTRQPVDLSLPAKRKMAQWLADQILIVQEAAANHITLPGSEAAKGKLESVKALYPSTDQYERDLERYGIHETDLAELLLGDLREQIFVDLRFRPEIQISDDDLKSFYETQSKGPSFEVCRADEKCRADVEKALTDQRAMDELDQWLIAARPGARIEYREKAFQ